MSNSMRFLLLCGLQICAVFANRAQAADVADHAIIPGFERFHSGQDANAADGGRLLLGELNCLSCHKAKNANSQLLNRQAPILSQVGSRVTPEYLRAFLSNPQAVKPGTSMPALFAAADPADRERDVEFLVHFLASTGVAVQTASNSGAARRGEDLFHKVGCVACHGSQKEGAATLPTSVPLGELDKKYTIGSLTTFLREPHKVRPSGRMPNMNLNEKEARDIANYFLQDVEADPNLKVKYYEGSWESLPDFNTLTPKSEGGAYSLDVSVAERNDAFGLVFEGFLQVPQDGSVEFRLGSDDGSRLLIDGREVITIDGVHPHSTRNNRVDLKAGPHPIRVEYFEGGGEQSLALDVKFSGGAFQSLSSCVTIEAQPKQSEDSFVVDKELARRGKLIFTSAGCASCHEMQVSGQRMASTQRAPDLGDLKTGGCLAEAPDNRRPHFSLNVQQRKALTAALAAPIPNADPKATIQTAMTTMNCYACHERDGIGGPERAREAMFKTTIPEMGDEGRIPPALNGVGDKLNDDWLKHVMNNGANDRPYMHTRMPKFGADNVGRIIDAFVKVDRKTEKEPVEYSEPPHRIASAGRFMVGEGALGCIKCHYFDKYKATGIQAMDLTTMTKRLRKDWFQRYLINPQRYRRGTRMPSAWPFGRSILPELLEGETDTQISAVWDYLSAGNKARIPAGLTGKMIELKPTDEPIIYRNFIESLSPRGIAVGYPEKAHLAYDAEDCCLALIWHGAFIDAGKHWRGRGQGFQGPLGDHVMSLVRGAPFAVMESGDSKWPKEKSRELGFRFKGYKLSSEGRPAFRYEWNNLRVTDTLVPVVKKPDAGFQRTLSISTDARVENLFFRAAGGKEIKALDENTWLVNNAIRMRVNKNQGSLDAFVRNENGNAYLIVPVSFQNGSAKIELTMDW